MRSSAESLKSVLFTALKKKKLIDFTDYFILSDYIIFFSFVGWRGMYFGQWLCLLSKVTAKLIFVAEVRFLVLFCKSIQKRTVFAILYLYRYN